MAHARDLPDPLVVLSGTAVPVAPGGQATVQVTVTNRCSIVEGYRLDVLGDGVAEWARVDPGEVSMMPKQETTASVVFSPPAGPAAPGGSYPFCVRAQSLNDADSSAVAEGEVQVGTIAGLQAKLVPLTSSGRWRGRHSLHISNWGNAPARLRLKATDPDDALGIMSRPNLLDVPVGVTVVSGVSVRTRRPMLRGSPVRLPFTVAVERDDQPPGPAPEVSTLDRPLVSGAFQQKPILGRILVPIALVLGLIVSGGFLYERQLERPQRSVLGDGTVPPVRGFSVTPVDEQSIQLGWPPVVGVDGFRISQSASEDDPEERSYRVEGDADGKLVDKLPPSTRKCFTIVALRSDNTSDPSKRLCVRTKAAPETPPAQSPTTQQPTTQQPTTQQPTTQQPTTEQPTTVQLDGSYIAAGALIPLSGGLPQRVEDETVKLKNTGLPAASLSTDDYELADANQRGPVNASWVVYAGPYDTAQKADNVCPQVKEISFQDWCLVYRVRAR